MAQQGIFPEDEGQAGTAGIFWKLLDWEHKQKFHVPYSTLK